MRQLMGMVVAAPFYRGVVKRKLKLATTIEFIAFSENRLLRETVFCCNMYNYMVVFNLADIWKRSVLNGIRKRIS